MTDSNHWERLAHDRVVTANNYLQRARAAEAELRRLKSKEDRIWIILREPRRIPERKGPFNEEWAKRFIREVMEARPAAYIIVIEDDGTGNGIWPTDGGEWLYMADRRSSPRIKRHTDAERAAHGNHQVWRHKKRGTVYSEVGTALLQTDGRNYDMQAMVVYRDAEGMQWVRSVDEFSDGRFEKVLTP